MRKHSISHIEGSTEGSPLVYVKNVSQLLRAIADENIYLGKGVVARTCHQVTVPPLIAGRVRRGLMNKIYFGGNT